MASRRASSSTAAANAAEVMTKPGGTGSSSAVMVARLAPLPPVSSTTWQRGSVNGSTSGASGVGTAVSSVGVGRVAVIGVLRAPAPARSRTSPTISTRPVEPLTRTRSPVLIRRVASEVPTTAGMPNSRETTAGCEAMPPASVTRPAILVNSTTQEGLVIRQTTISSRSHLAELLGGEDDARGALDHAGRGGQAGDLALVRRGAGRLSFSGKAHSDQYGKPTDSSVAVPIQSRGRTS